MNANIKTISGQWNIKTFPLIIIKHRLLKTDPTYKFVINANLHFKTDISLRRSPSNDFYYSIHEFSSVNRNTKIIPDQWIDALKYGYRLNFNFGSNYASDIFPTLGFATLNDKNIFDSVVSELLPNALSDGTKVFLDFTVNISKGFVKNKLGLDITKIKPLLLDNVSFNLLNAIRIKDDPRFKVEQAFIDSLQLTSDEIYLLDNLFSRNSTVMPTSSDDTNILYNYLIKADNPINIQQSVFGFYFNNIKLISVDNKDFSLVLNSDNKPLNKTIYSNTISVENY